MFPHFNTAEKISLISATTGAIGAVISMFAALRSRRANRIASEALDLSKRSFSISVKSERGDDCLVLSAVGSEQEINNLVIYFPHKLDLEPIALVSGNLKLLDVRIVPALRAYWDFKTPESPGKASVRLNAPVPVVVEVHGHTKGVSTLTKGIYDLYGAYVKSEGNSALKVQALALNNYAIISDDSQMLADRLLAQMESVVDKSATE
jgi:hypothetical protein